MSKMKKKILSFFSPQYFTYEKAPSWYTAIGVAGFLVALFFIFFLKRYLAAIVTILGVIVLYRYANLKPKKRKIDIFEEGIVVGDKEYPYEKLAGFWFVPTNDGVYLYIKTNRRFWSNISVPLETRTPDEIRRVLSPHLPELPSQGEEMTDRLMRFLKF